MVSINTNLSSLIVQQNLTKSTNALNQAIERMTTGFKINHASDNAANYSISNNMSSQLSSYNVAMENAEMGSDMIATAADTLDNMTSNAMRLKELCTQAQNGTYGKQSIDAMKAEANSVISHIVNQYKSAEYNGIKLFDVYSDKLAELQTNSDTPNTPIGLSSEITSPSADYNGFISDPVTYTDAQIAEMLANNTMKEISSIDSSTPISSGKYAISSAEDLAKLAEMVNSGKVTGGEFVLTSDVDISSWCAAHTNPDGTGGWTPIGNNTNNFKGTFDGNGHRVSGLYINKNNSDTDRQGIFGTTAAGSSIKNVGIVNADIHVASRSGALVGCNGSNISNCYSTGNISGTNRLGGLVGTGTGAVYTIENCYSECNITGTSEVCGGLVGVTPTGSFIINSSATGSVTGTSYVGGLVGNAGGAITNSYATGDVSSTGSANGGISFTGGLVGRLYKTSGTVEYKNNASFGNVSAAVSAGSGSLIGGIANGSSFATVTLTNQMTTNQLDSIGGTYKDGSTFTAVEEPENMEAWNSNISKFSTQTQLQVGINGNSSSQITTQTNLNIGIIKQLENLDISKASGLEFMDAFLNELSSKSTELGSATNRLTSALDSIQVSIDNLTSSRSTIKDADVAKVSSEYIRQQILQQASATLLATANQSPSIALQLI